MAFPARTTIPSAAFFNEAEGIGPGTASKSGQTITYTVTNAVNIPAGTKIRLEFSNIGNPQTPSVNYKVTVLTRDATNAPIDGPTESVPYIIKQINAIDIAKNAVTPSKIADGSITSTKPVESFMKRVTLFDTPAGNALGWNPDSATTDFEITESAVIEDNPSFVSVWLNIKPPSVMYGSKMLEGFS